MATAAPQRQTVLGILLTVVFMGGGATCPSSAAWRWREVIAGPNQPVHLLSGAMLDSSDSALDSTSEQILAQRNTPPPDKMGPLQTAADVQIDPPQRFPDLALLAIGTILLLVTLVGLSSAVSRME